MYYDILKTIKYAPNALLYFILTERGLGKTFASKKYCIDNFLQKGEQFIYVRRYDTELDLAMNSKFFKPLQDKGLYAECQFEAKKVKGVYHLHYRMNDDDEWVTIGYAVAMTSANKLKSADFPDVTTIIYDEFLIDTTTGMQRYLRKEPEILLDLIETVQRTRDNLRVFLLANAISISNPYFDYFSLSLPYESEYRKFKNGLIVVNYAKNTAFREFKKNTRFGQITKDTNYGLYAIDNKFLRDTDIFIKRRPWDAVCNFVFIIDGHRIGGWVSKRGDLYYSDNFDPNCRNQITLKASDHNETTSLSTLRACKPFILSVELFKQAKLFFENQKVKGWILPLISKFI